MFRVKIRFPILIIRRTARHHNNIIIRLEFDSKRTLTHSHMYTKPCYDTRVVLKTNSYAGQRVICGVEECIYQGRAGELSNREGGRRKFKNLIPVVAAVRRKNRKRNISNLCARVCVH